MKFVNDAARTIIAADVSTPKKQEHGGRPSAGAARKLQSQTDRCTGDFPALKTGSPVSSLWEDLLIVRIAGPHNTPERRWGIGQGRQGGLPPRFRREIVSMCRILITTPRLRSRPSRARRGCAHPTRPGRIRRVLIGARPGYGSGWNSAGSSLLKCSGACLTGSSSIRAPQRELTPCW